MTDHKLEEDEYLEAQAAVYREIGQALFEILDPSHHHDWQRILLEAEQTPGDSSNRQSFRVTLTLTDGLALPLIARPNVIESCRRLDLLARSRLGGASWSAFTYELRIGPTGPAFSCGYTYPEGIQ